MSAGRSARTAIRSGRAPWSVVSGHPGNVRGSGPGTLPVAHPVRNAYGTPSQAGTRMRRYAHSRRPLCSVARSMTSQTFTILAHRALLFGPDRAAENTLPAITAALGERFPIEFDITIDEQRRAPRALARRRAVVGAARAARSARAARATDPARAEREGPVRAARDPRPARASRRALALLPVRLRARRRRPARGALPHALGAGARLRGRAPRLRARAVRARVRGRRRRSRRSGSTSSSATTLREADVRLLVDAGKRCLYVSPDLHRPETPARAPRALARGHVVGRARHLHRLSHRTPIRPGRGHSPHDQGRHLRHGRRARRCRQVALQRAQRGAAALGDRADLVAGARHRVQGDPDAAQARDPDRAARAARGRCGSRSRRPSSA